MRDHERAGRAVEAAAKIISEGGVVAYPTETSYGLGADATDEKAVSKIFELKGRDEGKPLPVIVSDLRMAREYGEINAVAEMLANDFMPGPLTLVVDKKPGIPDIVSKEGIAFRVPSNHIARAIASGAGKPVTATSANASGEPSAYKESQLLELVNGKIPLVVSAGDLSPTPASTVVDVRTLPPKLIREGPVPFSEVLAQLKKFEPQTQVQAPHGQETQAGSQ